MGLSLALSNSKEYCHFFPKCTQSNEQSSDASSRLQWHGPLSAFHSASLCSAIIARIKVDLTLDPFCVAFGPGWPPIGVS